MTKQQKTWLFLGVTGAAVVLLVFILGFILYMRWGESQLGPPSEAYLNAVAAGEYERAYNMIGERWKAIQSLEEIRAMEEDVRENMGRLQSKRVLGFQIKSGADELSTITYGATFENAEAIITVTLTQEDGEWVVQGVQYDAPEAQQEEPVASG